MSYNFIGILVSDDGAVRRTGEVFEAQGATYIGLVILLTTCVPCGLVISLDVWKLVRWLQDAPRNTIRYNVATV